MDLIGLLALSFLYQREILQCRKRSVQDGLAFFLVLKQSSRNQLFIQYTHQGQYLGRPRWASKLFPKRTPLLGAGYPQETVTLRNKEHLTIDELMKRAPCDQSLLAYTTGKDPSRSSLLFYSLDNSDLSHLRMRMEARVLLM